MNMEVAMPRPLGALAEEVLQLAPEARARLLDRVAVSYTHLTLPTNREV